MGQGFPSQRLGINLSAGTALAQTGTVVLSNSNNVSWGAQLSASSIVITVDVGGVSAVSAGTTNLIDGQVVLSNSNGISFGLNGSTVTASADYVRSISAGTTNATGNQIVLSNSNNVSFGANGATITASAGALVLHYWEDGQPVNAFAAVEASSAPNLSFQRISVPANISATRLDMLGQISILASTNGSYSITVGMYTFAGSTASSVSSGQMTITWTSGTNVTASSVYGGQSGTRWRSVTLGTWNITPGQYLLGVMVSASGSVATTASVSLYGLSSISVNAAPGGGDYTNYFADGVFSTGTGALPASIHLSAINQTGASALAQPYVRLVGTGP